MVGTLAWAIALLVVPGVSDIENEWVPSTGSILTLHPSAFLLPAFLMELTNPILHRELRLGLLGRRMMLVHWLFVAVLALIVWLAWPRAPKLQVEKILISQQLFALFWGGLYLAVAVVSAAQSAVAITREKELGCFDLLCTTGLSPAKLLLGKFLSVVGYLLLLVVSTLPITAACYLLGGVTWGDIALNYMHLTAAAIVYGGIGLACSCMSERNHRALSMAFVIALPLAGLSVASGYARNWIEALGLMTILAAGDKFLHRVRRPAEEYAPPVQYGSSIEITVDTDSALDRILVPRREPKPLSDDKNPVFEREWIEESGAEGRDWWHFLLRFNIGLAVLVVAFLVFGKFWVEDYANRFAPGQYDQLIAMYADRAQLGLFAYLIIVAVLIGPAQSANSISKERERQTFDLLLTTLLSPREIVLGKWNLSLRSSSHLLLLLVLPMLPVLALIFYGRSGDESVGLLVGTGIAGLAIVAVTLVTLNTLGMFCSLVCRSSAHALSWTYSVAVGWFLGPVIVYAILTKFSELPPTTYAWMTHATPFLSFFALSGSRFFSQVGLHDQPLWLALVYLGLTLAVTIALLFVSIACFHRFWRRT